VIDIASLLDIAVFASLVAAPLVLVRFLTREEPVDLSRLFAIPSELPWPHGVQEEEPQPWRLGLLERRRSADDRATQVSDSPPRPRPAPVPTRRLDTGRCA
jgi:hypothetical protein